MDRRKFLQLSAVAGGAFTAVGTMSGQTPSGKTLAAEPSTPVSPAPMLDFAAPKIERPRVGILGCGCRGSFTVVRMREYDFCEITAVCDLLPERANEKADWVTHRKNNPRPDVYTGEEGWKKMCAADNVDVIYNCGPWSLHAPANIFAMEHGKHVGCELPLGLTVDECWRQVETSERTQRHCMLLENYCYMENMLLGLNATRQGAIGKLTHGECGYVHELVGVKLAGQTWRTEYSKTHTGNPYTTHGLGPMAMILNLNRGDTMDFLVSVSSAPMIINDLAKRMYPNDNTYYKLGDMNTSIIRTVNGKTILLRHDTHTPRPAQWFDYVQGDCGIIADHPLRVALRPKQETWLTAEELAAFKKQYDHPVWTELGKSAEDGMAHHHGGSDPVMDARFLGAIREGRPTDISVYDSALWSCLTELTEKSVLSGSQPVKIPDFTRGAWKTAGPAIL